jgi:SAM-dependent methyltransferase
MSWDQAWETLFRSRDWGRYPPEELIRFVARNYYPAPNRASVSILEVGCGTGANLWYLAREQFDAHGMDGSETAIAKARSRMGEENLRVALSVGDIAHLDRQYPADHFSAVIDIVCLQHNRLSEIEQILRQVRTVLKSQGRVFSMMCAEGTYGDGLGRRVEPGTYVDIAEGPYQGVGLTHFFSLEEVRALYSGFNQLKIEYSIRSLENQSRMVQHWVIEGVKS